MLVIVPARQAVLHHEAAGVGAEDAELLTVVELEERGHLEAVEVVCQFRNDDVRGIEQDRLAIAVELHVAVGAGVHDVVATDPEGLRLLRFQFGELTMIEDDHPVAVIEEGRHVLRTRNDGRNEAGKRRRGRGTQPGPGRCRAGWAGLPLLR